MFQEKNIQIFTSMKTMKFLKFEIYFTFYPTLVTFYFLTAKEQTFRISIQYLISKVTNNYVTQDNRVMSFFSSSHVYSHVRHSISLELVLNLSLQKPLQIFGDFTVRQMVGTLWELPYDIIILGGVDLVTLKGNRMRFTFTVSANRNTCSKVHKNMVPRGIEGSTACFVISVLTVWNTSSFFSKNRVWILVFVWQCITDTVI